MQSVVNLYQGFHLNIFPVITAAFLMLFFIYLISGRKVKKSDAKAIPSRKETYQFMYNQLLEKEATTGK
jgi:hypothetical protein